MTCAPAPTTPDRNVLSFGPPPTIPAAALPALPDTLTLLQDRDIRHVPAPSGMANGHLTAQMFLNSKIDGENTVMKAHYNKGVRTQWHSHPLGQMLFILSGTCLVQRQGGGMIRAAPGDVVWLAPNEIHRHGASDAEAMSYLSVQGVKSGEYSVVLK